MTSPIQADGSVVIADRTDLQQRPAAAGSLRAVGTAAWLIAAQWETDEQRIRVTTSTPSRFRVDVLVELRWLFIWPSERREMLEAIKNNVRYALPIGATGYITIRTRWRSWPP